MRGTYVLPRVLLLASLVLPCAAAMPQDPGPYKPSNPSSSHPSSTPSNSSSRPNSAPAPAAAPQSDHLAPAPQQIHSPGDSPITHEPPAQPVEEIIKRFSEQESSFKRERENYTYTQAITFQTLDDDDRPDGEYREVFDITFTNDGKRFEHVTFAPQNTLTRVQMTREDEQNIRDIQPFVLTAEDIVKYNVTYVGRQQVDDLSCYIFDVAPKTIEKNQRYFQGRVWVDDHDLQIVMSDGKAVPDIIKHGTENVFPRFRTYRENIEKGFWFPVYTRADDYLHFRSGDVHVRMTVRYSNYKRFGSTVKIGTAREIKDPPPQQ